jgi:hypothetical protein
MTRRRTYWLCQLGGWGAHALGEIVVLAFVSNYVLWGVLINVLNMAWGIGLTHGYRAFVKWRGWTSRSVGALAPRVAAATLVLSLTFVLGSQGIVTAASPLSPFDIPAMDLSPAWLGDLAYLTLRMSPVLLLWSVLYFGIHYFWNYRDAEVDRLQLALNMRGAKLEALRLQLNPHFLFNSLNSVRALIGENPDAARRMVTKLARLLRAALSHSGEATVPLQTELRLVRTYLEVEAVRLEDRLRYEIDVDPAVDNPAVPLLLVQTLVENGIKHGVAPAPDGGSVQVDIRHVEQGDSGASADAEDESAILQIQVSNTGTLDRDASPAPAQAEPGRKEPSQEGADQPRGVGVQNVRERLRLLYGASAQFALCETDGRVEATVQIPLSDESPFPDDVDALSGAQAGGALLAAPSGPDAAEEPAERSFAGDVPAR